MAPGCLYATPQPDDPRYTGPDATEEPDAAISHMHAYAGAPVEWGGCGRELGLAAGYFWRFGWTEQEQSKHECDADVPTNFFLPKPSMSRQSSHRNAAATHGCGADESERDAAEREESESGGACGSSMARPPASNKSESHG